LPRRCRQRRRRAAGSKNAARRPRTLKSFNLALRLPQECLSGGIDAQLPGLQRASVARHEEANSAACSLSCFACEPLFRVASAQRIELAGSPKVKKCTLVI